MTALETTSERADMMGLEDQVAVVTGASSGIGAGIARALARRGSRVMLLGRREDALRDTLALLEDDGVDIGDRAATLALDLTEPSAPSTVVRAVLERFGRLSVLIHSAGIFRTGPIAQSYNALDEMWEVNVRAPYRLTGEALPALRESRGSVLFISSIAGQVGLSGASAYCATKGAVEQLVRSLAVEEGPHGVRVNAIAPGNIHTPMNAHLFADPKHEESLLEQTPLLRIGEVDDIADLTAVLVSRMAGYVTGQSVTVDGGWTAR